MSLADTVIARFKKLLRVELAVKPPDIAKLTAQSTLGGAPLGFDDEFVNTDLRHRINTWFEEMSEPLPNGTWDGTSTIGVVAADLVNASAIDDEASYLAHATDRAAIALDRAIGASTPSVPVADRPRVQTALNVSLQTMLIREVALGDLAGSRDDIIDDVVGKMIV
jgi:hypothetical protein